MYPKYFPVITMTGPRQSEKPPCCEMYFKQGSHIIHLKIWMWDVLHWMILWDFLPNIPKEWFWTKYKTPPTCCRTYREWWTKLPWKALRALREFSIFGHKTDNPITCRTYRCTGIAAFMCNEVKKEADEETLDNVILKGFFPALYAGKTSLTCFIHHM